MQPLADFREHPVFGVMYNLINAALVYMLLYEMCDSMCPCSSNEQSLCWGCAERGVATKLRESCWRRDPCPYSPWVSTWGRFIHWRESQPRCFFIIYCRMFWSCWLHMGKGSGSSMRMVPSEDIRSGLINLVTKGWTNIIDSLGFWLQLRFCKSNSNSFFQNSDLGHCATWYKLWGSYHCTAPTVTSPTRAKNVRKMFSSHVSQFMYILHFENLWKLPPAITVIYLWICI